MLVRRLDGNHDMTFGHGIADMAVQAEACAQNVKTRLLLLQQEWFLDTDAGVPWLQDIMVKPANLLVAQAEIKRCILQTDGVQAIERFDLLFDSQTRKMTVVAALKTIYGTVNNIKVST